MMGSSNGKATPPKRKKAITSSDFLQKLRKRRIIETLAAFIGGGWLLLEFVHWLLVDHYHFPEKTIDITFVTILGALLCTLVWRWYAGLSGPRKFKVEFVLLPVIILIILSLDINLLMHLEKSDSARPPEWKNSIAVLPFKDISPGQGQDYFCEGLTVELIARLSQIKDLKVVARTSAFSFKGKDLDIREVGKRLDVKSILEGEVRKAGNKLRITAQLINSSDGSHLWSDTYDKDETDIIAIQKDISEAVVNALQIQLMGQAKGRLVRNYTTNQKAHDLYLKGRFYWERRERRNLEIAIDFFNKAIGEDPSYALAYCGIADCYAVLADNAMVPAKEAYPKSKAAALKAIGIDPTLAEAHVPLAAAIEEFDHNFPEAEKEYQIAIMLNPGYASAHHWYALFLSCQGQHTEALREIEIARRLDPLSPRINVNVWFILSNARRYGLAIEEAKHSLELFPEHAAAYQQVAILYALTGRYEEAQRAINHALELDPEYGEAILIPAYCYALSGDSAMALKKLEEVLGSSKLRFVSCIEIARVYTGLGEKEKAFSWLDRAYLDNEARLNYLKVDPTFDPLRADPRYSELIHRIGFRE
jgi:TolB-like protein/Tfp pilus assembly protein PilF